jgi:four helix bundle protein
MNNREVTMHDPKDPTGLEAHGKAVKAAGIAISIALKVPGPLRRLGDQVIRSASSVPANQSEGHGRSGRDRTDHHRIAYASAKEVDTHLRPLCISGAIPRDQAVNALQLFDDVRAMTWGLLHSGS